MIPLYRWYLQAEVGTMKKPEHTTKQAVLMWTAFQDILAPLVEGFESEGYVEGFRCVLACLLLRMVGVLSERRLFAHFRRFVGTMDIKFTSGREVRRADIYTCFFAFVAGACAELLAVPLHLDLSTPASSPCFQTWRRSGASSALRAARPALLTPSASGTLRDPQRQSAACQIL